MKNSRTKSAVDWINAEAGRTQYQAAKLFDVSQPAISAALRKQTECIDLWKKHGLSIEAGSTAGILPSQVLKAMRGKHLIHNVAPRTDGVLSKTEQALEIVATQGCSLAEAARRAGVTIGGVYIGRNREAELRRLCDTIGRDMFGRMAIYLQKNPEASGAQLANWFELTPVVASAALKILKVDARRALIPKPESERTKALREAASMARLIGGEAGEQIAQAIESL